MKLSTVLGGRTFQFRTLKEVLAKANEEKSGDVLAGIAAESDLERVAAKLVLSRLLVRDLRENPAVPYEDDEVTRLNQDSIDPAVYGEIAGWSISSYRLFRSALSPQSSSSACISCRVTGCSSSLRSSSSLAKIGNLRL